MSLASPIPIICFSTFNMTMWQTCMKKNHARFLAKNTASVPRKFPLFFATLTKRRLKHGVFRSITDLFIRKGNLTIASLDERFADSSEACEPHA
jgi:hypothetical protein